MAEFIYNKVNKLKSPTPEGNKYRSLMRVFSAQFYQKTDQRVNTEESLERFEKP